MKKKDLKTGNKIILEDGQELLVLLNADIYGYANQDVLVSLKEQPDYFEIVSLDHWDEDLHYISNEEPLNGLDIVQCYRTDNIIKDNSIDMLYDVKDIYFSNTDKQILNLIDTNLIRFILKKGNILRLYNKNKIVEGGFPISEGVFSDLPQNYFYDLNQLIEK